MRAEAGVEDRVVLHDTHGSLDRIQRRSAGCQDGPTRLGRRAAAGLMIGVKLARDIPRAAVNNDPYRHSDPSLIVEKPNGPPHPLHPCPSAPLLGAAQQVTWNSPSVFPSASFHFFTALGVGQQST